METALKNSHSDIGIAYLESQKRDLTRIVVGQDQRLNDSGGNWPEPTIAVSLNL
jgi:hypothetical protein